MSANAPCDRLSKGKTKPLRGVNSYDIEKLYKEVWTMPTENIGEKYGVSGSTIRKMCARLNIPLPPISYWERSSGNESKKIRDAKGILNFMPVKDIVTIAKTANDISLSEEVKHPVLLNHQKSMKKWARYNEVDDSAPRNKNTFDKSADGSPALWGCVSENTMPRVYLILESLYKAFESVGCTVNADLSLVIQSEIVRFNITECKTEVLRSQEDVNCDDRVTDYIYNGQLWFALEKDYFIKDTGTLKIEDRLCEIFLLLYAKSEKVRIEREAKEDNNRQQAERKMIKKLFRDEHDRQIDMLRELENEAADYERAERIRKYISSLNTDNAPQEFTQWVEWASGMADWLDPSTATTDKYFGKRDHKKNEKEKRVVKFKSK